MISVKNDMSKKVKKRVRCNECAYSLCQTHSFQEEGPKDHSRKNDTYDASSSRMYVFPMPNSHSCPRHQNQKKVKKEAKSQKNHQNRTSPRLVPKVVQNKAFGEGTKRALTKWCEFGVKNWSKKTLSIIKKWWETLYDFKNSAFRWQWFFWPTLAEWCILLYDLHQFLKSKSFKRGSRNAAAVQNVQSYLSEKQNYQNALI